jgi:hypothetical protein
VGLGVGLGVVGAVVEGWVAGAGLVVGVGLDEGAVVTCAPLGKGWKGRERG